MTLHPDAATTVRCGDAATLAEALIASRHDTLATFAVFERALPGLVVPLLDTLNPPLWELGHIGWFQEYWIERNPQRGRGSGTDPEAPRGAPGRAGADALYDSSRVPHDTRWQLPLPDADATRDDLARQLQRTLALLQASDPGDDALYFFRLALLHEDMHHEAALYMAQSLGLEIADRRWQPAPLAAPRASLRFEAGPWPLGYEGPGFAFDNELASHAVHAAACDIDSRVLTWAEFLVFAESGGYDQPQWWSGDGAAWRSRQTAPLPRYLRQDGRTWLQWRHGRWSVLDLALPACHLSAHEAEAWCRWAGRRLPTETEWERAALARPEAFGWGQVWEWTASPFLPYPGFTAHPYRDYAAPWFGSRPVLRGASFMTQPRMRHPRYRNFFGASRHDVPAGFRSCRADS